MLRVEKSNKFTDFEKNLNASILDHFGLKWRVLSVVSSEDKNIDFKHSYDQIKIQDFCIVICNK